MVRTMRREKGERKKTERNEERYRFVVVEKGDASREAGAANERRGVLAG